MTKPVPEKFADLTRSGYLGAFILLLISYIISFVSAQNLAKQSAWVAHSNEVLHTLDNILRYVTESESAARGYIITNNKAFLEKFDRSSRNADSAWNSIKLFTADNTAQRSNMDSLKILIDDKMKLLKNSLAFFDSTHSINMLLSRQWSGIEKMKNLENYVHYIQNTEIKVLYNRNKKASKYSNIIKIFTIVSLLLAILLTLYSVITFTKENKAKQDATKKANLYQQELEKRVDELASLNLELIELRNIEKFASTGRIARTIAHEVRNPLTNIKLATEQLSNEVPQNTDLDLLFKMIHRNADRINELINNLLNATKVNDLSFQKISINDVIDNSLEFAQDRINLKKIKVVKNYAPSVCPIVIDREKVAIALLNIIVNAIEAMDEYGTLSISTQTKNNRCLVKISDTGKGMTKEEINSLFEPFFTTKEKGTGLGLTNTQNIILAHGGNISVESEKNKGTTFNVSFAIV